MNNATPSMEMNRMLYLCDQISHIFSLESIANNMYLIDEMDEEGYLPVERILSFPKVLKLNATISDVLEAISLLPHLDLSHDQQHVRLNLPIERKTIIIRDTPKQTTEEEIRLLFQDNAISIRREVGNTWFITLNDEQTAMNVIRYIQNKSLHEEPIKARIKSEFYKKELLRRLTPYLPEESPKRKLSSAAIPFTPEPFSNYWGVSGLNGFDFGYNLPLVITTPEKKSYPGAYCHYSREELYSIIRNMRDFTLPLISRDILGYDIILEEANCDLVEKGRTLSIDQALENGTPRTFSIDSVDYTNMVGGYMGDEVTAHLKKKRKQKKRG